MAAVLYLYFTKAGARPAIYANRTGGPVCISCAVREALAPAVRARFNRPYTLTVMDFYERELYYSSTRVATIPPGEGKMLAVTVGAGHLARPPCWR